MLALFVLGVICILFGCIAFFTLRGKKKVIAVSAFAGACVIGVALMGGSCIRTVPTGHTGIVTTFGSVENYTYEAGVHVSAPWQEVICMDNRNQKASVDLMAFSSDIQEVTVAYTLNYQIEKANAQKIYKEIGVSYYETVIAPRVTEAVKSVIAQYTAEELLSNRALLSQDIRNILTDKLTSYNIEVLDASLENLDFSDAFTDAVEAKQVAEQKSKQAQIEQNQKTMETEAAAKRAEIDAKAAAAVAKISAQADLDVVKIQADAAEYAGQKDAAVIAQVRDVLAADAENLTDADIRNLIYYYYVQKWDGKLPETYFGSEDLAALLAALGKKNP